MPEEARIFHFHSDAVGDDTFQVASMKGFEEISAPYEIEFDLVSTDAEIAPDEMLNNKAWLTIRQSVPVSGGKRGTRLYKLHGVLSSFEILEKVHEVVKYRAVLVPRLWKASLTTQSRVFLEKNIPDIIKDVLTKLKGGALAEGDDFEFRLNETYAAREFVVQYNETDLEFLNRWTEHQGIFYFFEQTENGEKIVFADSNDACQPLAGDPPVPYRPDPATRSRAAGSTSEETLQEETVHSFRLLMRKTPKEVVLKDYNYRTPSVDLKVTQDVDAPAAEGMFYMYGEHYKDKNQGKDLAKLRAQAFQCRDKTFDGKGDHRSFRPGSLVNLSEHYREDFNASYLLIRVRHTLVQGTGSSGGVGGSISYSNEFECIPGDDAFRPVRRTPWPSIHGLMNARVDAGGDGQYAEIDDQGRYKIKLPFDLGDADGGTASRWIRMAQPYAGAGMGMHFPLHKDTEVLLAFIDGDPDRPIIAAAIPNAETGGPVAAGNQTQCAIHTGGGSQMVIEDTDGNQRIHLSTPTQGTYFQMGSKTDGGGGSNGAGGGDTGAAAPGAEDGVSMGTDADLNFQSARDYIHRTGGNVTIETTKNELKITKGNTASETHGNSRSWTQGDSETEVVGNSKSKVTGNSESEVTGNSKSKTIGTTDETFIGKKTSKTIADLKELTIGNKKALTLSNSMELSAGNTIEVFVGNKIESAAANTIEASTGTKITLCEAEELKTAAQKLEEVTGANKMTGGTITIDATTDLLLEGGSKITLKCGGSEITMSSSEIVIKSATIKLDASGQIDGKSGGVFKIKGSALDVSGQAMHK